MTTAEITSAPWVAVSDRLPDDGRSMLVFIEHPGFYRVIEIGYYQFGDRQWIVDGFEVNVTHWAPLPKPPVR